MPTCMRKSWDVKVLAVFLCILGNVHRPFLAAPAPVYSWTWNVSERASCLQLQPLLLQLSQININPSCSSLPHGWTVHLVQHGRLGGMRHDPGRCLHPYFLLLFIKLESIVTKLEFPELLKELHLWGRLLSAVETEITAGKRSFC